jgi:ribosomal protein L7Ae-like RNA K-turn-binding protein
MPKIKQVQQDRKMPWDDYISTVESLSPEVYARQIDSLSERYGVESKVVIRQQILGRPIDQQTLSQYSPTVFKVWKKCMKYYSRGKKEIRGIG